MTPRTAEDPIFREKKYEIKTKTAQTWHEMEAHNEEPKKSGGEETECPAVSRKGGGNSQWGCIY